MLSLEDLILDSGGFFVLVFFSLLTQNAIETESFCFLKKQSPGDFYRVSGLEGSKSTLWVPLGDEL